MFVVKDAQAQAVTINILDFSQGEWDCIDLSSLFTTLGICLRGRTSPAATP
jgi:hypothetical protein